MWFSVGDAAVTAQGADGAGDGKEARGPPLASTIQSPEAVPPGHGAPHNLPAPARPTEAPNAATRNARRGVSAAQQTPRVIEAVSPVAMRLERPTRTRALDRHRPHRRPPAAHRPALSPCGPPPCSTWNTQATPRPRGAARSPASTRRHRALLHRPRPALSSRTVPDFRRQPKPTRYRNPTGPDHSKPL